MPTLSGLEDFLKKRPPIGSPVSTGRGQNEPLKAPQPSGPAQPNAAMRSKPGSSIGGAMPQGNRLPNQPQRVMPPPPSQGMTQKPGDAHKTPIPRTNQDDISRPITSPSTTNSIGGTMPQGQRLPNQPVPVGPDGRPKPIAPVPASEAPGSPGAPKVGEAKPRAVPTAPGAGQPVAGTQPPQASTGIEAADQVAQVASTPIEGQELPGSGLAQGMPGEGVPLNATGQPMSAQEQNLQLQAEMQAGRGDTSGFLSGIDANKAQEDMRRAQPSKIPSIPQGTYEAVVKDRYEEYKLPSGAPMSARQHAAFKEDAHKQLEEFGDWPSKGDPRAPKPPIRPGGRSYNPFTGKFTGERGPNAFTLMGFDMEAAKAEFFKTGGRG